MHRVPWPDEDGDMHRAPIGHQTKALAAVITNWSDITTLKAVQPDEDAHRLREPFRGKRDSETVHFRRGAKSLKMRVHPEDCGPVLGLVATDSFEHSRAIVKGMR